MFYKLFFLILLIGLSSCSFNVKEANQRAVERFRLQILEGNFEEIYESSKENTKYFISKEEFLENMNKAVGLMKEYDQSLVWERDEAADDFRVREFANYSETSWRKMRKDGKILDITISWDNAFTFCDLVVREDAPDKPEIVVTRCSKS